MESPIVRKMLEIQEVRGKKKQKKTASEMVIMFFKKYHSANLMYPSAQSGHASGMAIPSVVLTGHLLL